MLALILIRHLNLLSLSKPIYQAKYEMDLFCFIGSPFLRDEREVL